MRDGTGIWILMIVAAVGILLAIWLLFAEPPVSPTTNTTPNTTESKSALEPKNPEKPATKPSKEPAEEEKSTPTTRPSKEPAEEKPRSEPAPQQGTTEQSEAAAIQAITQEMTRSEETFQSDANSVENFRRTVQIWGTFQSQCRERKYTHETMPESWRTVESQLTRQLEQSGGQARQLHTRGTGVSNVPLTLE